MSTTCETTSVLPTPSSQLQEFMSAAADPRTSTRQLMKLVGGIRGAGPWVKAASENEYLGAGRAVTSAADASFVLGKRGLRNMVAVYVSRQLARRMKPEHMPLELYWENAMRRGTAALLLAQHLNFESPEEAFTLAFIQDLGCLLLPMEAPEQARAYAAVFRSPAKVRVHQEREIFGRHHMEVFEEIQRAWHLPDEYLDLVDRHHGAEPSVSGRRQDRLRLLIYVADAITDVFQTGGHPDTVTWARKQLARATERVPISLLDLAYQVEATAPTLAKLLDIPYQGRPEIFVDLEADRRPPDPDQTDELAQLKRELRKVRKEREQLNSVLRRLSGELRTNDNLDPTTKLANRSYALDSLELLLTHSKEKAWPLCVILFDIDGMHAINKIQGYLLGDELLKDLAARANTIFRPSDLLARIDGDAFLAVLPRTPIDGGVVAGRRVQEAIRGSSFQLGTTSHQVTVSVGGYAFRPEAPVGITPDAMLLHAEMALRQAREMGGDKLVWKQ